MCHLPEWRKAQTQREAVLFVYTIRGVVRLSGGYSSFSSFRGKEAQHKWKKWRCQAAKEEKTWSLRGGHDLNPPKLQASTGYDGFQCVNHRITFFAFSPPRKRFSTAKKGCFKQCVELNMHKCLRTQIVDNILETNSLSTKTFWSFLLKKRKEHFWTNF